MRRTLAVATIIMAMLLAGCTGGTDEAPTTEGMDLTPKAPDVMPINGSTHFEFGPSAGCANIGVRPTCWTFDQGPGTEPVDGFWIPLDPSYWRHAFTSTVDNANGDSDCVFIAEDGTTILGIAFRGAAPCGGTVVDGTAYIFLYSFLEPATTMTLTFDADGGGA